jgi:hypothetical protein
MIHRTIVHRLLPLAALVAVLATAGCGSGGTSSTASKPTVTVDDAVQARDLVSRQDLRPPVIAIRHSAAGQAPGLVFLTPKKVFGAKVVQGAQGGTEIIDNKGKVRYFAPNKGHNVANDFRVQEYEGKPVLTYWYGRQLQGTGRGYGVILDEHYKRIATVHAGNGLDADFHEFQLTPQNTALITVFHKTTAGDKKVVEGVIQEIDVKTGKVLTEWHSLDGVPVSASYEPADLRKGSFDYIHLNAADVAADGNILVSGRHTWAIYEIERHTGKLLSTIGGKQSDYKMGPGAQTAWQHDVVSLGEHRYSVFDNGAGDTGTRALRDYSRIAEITIDPTKKTATLVKSYKHPDGLSAGTQGNGQLLPNGDMFVGWGSKGVASEFSPDGKLLFDARVPKGDDTYRAFKSPWTGIPSSPPDVAATVHGTKITIDVSWNGSTEVRSWRALTGTRRTALTAAGRSAWKDLETGFTVPAGSAKYVAVAALDAAGKVLATSATVKLSR